MRIIVRYNNSSYYWVDTIITSVDCIYAILVSDKGVAFPARLEKIEVVDGNYHCEKQIQREIIALESETSILKSQMALTKKLQEVINERPRRN